MARLTARDFAPEVLALYDGYVHGRLSRRDFLDGAAKYAATGFAASTLLSALGPDYSLAQQISFTDPDIEARYITYPSPEGHGVVRAYLVRPTKEGGKSSGGVVVVHENRGLNPYSRLAKAGFVALAPDGLSSVGGYPGNDDEGRRLQQQVDPEKLMNDFFAAITWLQAGNEGNGRVGITGFCYGGGVAAAASIVNNRLAAAVPFYGRQPRIEDVAKINAPLLFHFAENDPRINATWPACEAALKQEGKTYEAYIYEGTHHGFHNDSTPRYDEVAAGLAWARTITWFRRYLDG